MSETSTVEKAATTPPETNGTAPAAETPRDGASADAPDGGIYVWYEGVRYELSIPAPDDYTACRDRLKSRMVDPLDGLMEALDNIDKRYAKRPPGIREELKRRLTDKAYADLNIQKEDRVPTNEQLSAWMDGAEAGRSFLFYRLLLRRAAGMTEDLAKKIADAAGKTGYEEALAKVRARLKEQQEAAAKVK
jgi:hypothetical protein